MEQYCLYLEGQILGNSKGICRFLPGLLNHGKFAVSNHKSLELQLILDYLFHIARKQIIISVTLLILSGCYFNTRRPLFT